MAKLIPGTEPIRPPELEPYKIGEWKEPPLERFSKLPTFGDRSWKDISNAATEAALRVYHKSVGFGSGRYTFGMVDVAAAKFAKRYAEEDIKDQLSQYGVEVTDVSDVGQPLWKLTNGPHIQFINPERLIEGTYAKDLGEVFAKFSGLDISPTDQTLYDAARFVGSLKNIHKAVKHATKMAQLHPRVLRVLQGGITGLTTDTLMQVEDAMSEKQDSFSFTKALKTGGIFVAFGGVVEGIGAGRNAIADAHFVKQWFNTPNGIASLKQNLTHGDLKHWISAQRAYAQMPYKPWMQRYAKNQRLSKIAWKLDKAKDSIGWKPSAVKLLPEKIGVSTAATLEQEAVLVQKTISKFPQKVKDQQSLKTVGNAIAKELGLRHLKIDWVFVDSPFTGEGAWATQRALEPGRNQIKIATKGYSQGFIKNNIVHELGHIAKVPIFSGGKRIIHYPAFNKWVAKGHAGLTYVSNATRANPYFTMPLERVAEDAQHGVTLAKEALARISPESALGKGVVTPINNLQVQAISKLADKHKLASVALSKVIQTVTGESSISTMNTEQAQETVEHLKNLDYLAKETEAITDLPAVTIDPFLPKGSAARIRAIAKSDKVMNKTMLYSQRLGGVPKNEDIPDLSARQKSFAKDLETAARIQRRHIKKQARKEPTGKEVNMVNPWSSVRYALGQAELKSGIPLRRLFSNVVAEHVGVKEQNTAAIENAVREAGIHRIGAPATFAEGKQVAGWLFSDDPEIKQALWQGMTEPIQKLTSSYQRLLQGRSALLVRWRRWQQWDVAAKLADSRLEKLRASNRKVTKAAVKKIMAPVKDMIPKDAPPGALLDGRAAKETGQLLDWLETQDWGTRKFYYMTDRELKNLADVFPSGTVPEELEAAATLTGKQPELNLPETMTREGQGRIAKNGSITAAILHHMNRVGVSAATSDDLSNFWEAFSSTNPSRKDINSVRMLVNTVLGFHHAVEPTVKIARGASRAFWRAYFLSPKRSMWFSTRNLHQNIAYGLSQTSLSEIAKSSVQMVADRNPWMKEAYEKFWVSRISQRKQLQHQFILQKQGSIVSDFGNKSLAVIDLIGSAPIYSDEMNRLMAWPVLHQTAYRNVNQFMDGKISYQKLIRHLDIDTLHATQRLELKRLLDDGDLRSFVANYAEYKTENIHFRYETALRSVSEQTPTGRTLIGLATFPRGTFEIMYQNGIKPFIQGFETGNYQQSYKGLKAIIGGIFGSRAARWLLYGITGRIAYGVFDTVTRYTPVAPGAARLQELFDDVSNAMWQAQEYDKSIAETADDMMAVATGQLELFIPFCDVALDYYETKNDVYGVRLYSLLKRNVRQQYLDETGKRFRAADRAYHERVQHLFWGGAEKGKAAGERPATYRDIHSF